VAGSKLGEKLSNSKLLFNALIVLLTCINPAALISQDKFVRMVSRAFPGGHKEDGMWTALSAASDGKIYIGLCTSGNSAHFYIYDPERDELRHRSDIADEIGESGKGIRTSSKIHSLFVEDNDGKIYFATAPGGPKTVDRRSFAGGHWLRYDPQNDRIEDLGLVLPYQGLYALVIDVNRKRLYGSTDWGHFVIFDINKRITIDKGKVNNRGNVIRYMVIDDEGIVYGNHDSNKIFRYNPIVDRIEDLAIEIPADKTILPRKSINFNYYWRAAFWDVKSKAIYGIERMSSTLFQYDPKAGSEGEMKSLAQLCADPYLGARTMPRATLAFTLGKNEKIYYAPVAQPFDYSSEELGYIKSKQVGRRHYSHLVTYDLKTKTRQDHGVIKVEDDQRLLGVGGATTAPDGTIYFCGAVDVKETRRAAGMVAGKVPFALRLIIHQPKD
jgi:hypothetical protein